MKKILLCQKIYKGVKTTSSQVVKMMQDTTRKIPKESILLLDELELNMRRRGLKMNQKEMIRASIAFVAQREKDFLKYIQRKDNTKEQTEKFLQHAKKFDFGKKWMEDIDTCQ